jgi:hypothetical protein
MRNILFVILMALAMTCAGCGSRNTDFIADNSAQQSVSFGEAATLTLLSGASLEILAGTYAQEVIIMLSDLLVSFDSDATYFPTIAQDPEDIIAGLVVNTPADTLATLNLHVTFAFRDGVTVTPGAQYAVYRFDHQGDERQITPRWNRWGSTIATVNATGTLATATLPTTDFRGYVGSLGLFVGHTVDVLPAVTPTTITGVVRADGGGNLATDVGLYIVVGAKKYAAAVTNGRVPVLPDPNNDSLSITHANTVDSLADGSFTIAIPENLIGQFISLEFGTESTAHQLQDYFDWLEPADDVDAPAMTPVLVETPHMVIWYGENKVRSYPVENVT